MTDGGSLEPHPVAGKTGTTIVVSHAFPASSYSYSPPSSLRSLAMRSPLILSPLSPMSLSLSLSRPSLFAGGGAVCESADAARLTAVQSGRAVCHGGGRGQSLRSEQSSRLFERPEGWLRLLRSSSIHTLLGNQIVGARSDTHTHTHRERERERERFEEFVVAKSRPRPPFSALPNAPSPLAS